MEPSRLVFLDEAGAKTNMTHLYGRMPPAKRVIERAPGGHWWTTTMVGALRHDRVEAPLVMPSTPGACYPGVPLAVSDLRGQRPHGDSGALPFWRTQGIIQVRSRTGERYTDATGATGRRLAHSARWCVALRGLETYVSGPTGIMSARKKSRLEVRDYFKRTWRMAGIDPGAGVADPRAVVEQGSARFTVLTPTLLRLEYAPNALFEDRPSLFAVRRKLPICPFRQRQERDWLTVKTDALTLGYRTGSGQFRRSNVYIRLASASQIEWRPGMPSQGNLGGTARTLDECTGPIDLGNGVLSRDGWFLLDDSTRPVFQDQWISSRPYGDRQDWYFFGYAQDFQRALRDLTAVAGKIPLPPRFVFGSWYSRYWPYRAAEFMAIADEYAQFGFPLDVMVMDMNWHLEGWTGYTWNRELIPDPEGLLSALHDRRLKVALNLHPADGVQPHEEAYPAFAKAMGRDAETKKPIEFDCTDPIYMKNYFELLHHPLEAQGVDFWWIDWQQGSETSVAGLEPLSWLNHLHFCDLQRDRAALPCSRGLTLSRWGGWGSHRYPIQFSGDTWATWEMFRFLVEFTATAGNVGAVYWSHDLGGHFAKGRTDPELFVRWVQFGAFSATMRVHTTLSAENDRRPWLDGEPFTAACRAAFALRYRLLPYIYTMARKCHDTGLPLNRPMYLVYPTETIAYELPEQFLFGDDLLVAPVLRPGHGADRIAEVEVWLPEGDWFDLTTHKRYAGPARHTIYAALSYTPVFARAGQPIPMARPGRTRTIEALNELYIRVYPGESGASLLYEDDGESTAYLDGHCAWTPLRYEGTVNGCCVHVGPTQGVYESVPRARHLVVELPATTAPTAVSRNGYPIAPGQWKYDTSERTTVIRISDLMPAEVCTVNVEFTGRET